jgi:hypothetical protein
VQLEWQKLNPILEQQSAYFIFTVIAGNKNLINFSPCARAAHGVADCAEAAKQSH